MQMDLQTFYIVHPRFRMFGSPVMSNIPPGSHTHVQDRSNGSWVTLLPGSSMSPSQNEAACMNEASKHSPTNLSISAIRGMRLHSPLYCSRACRCGYMKTYVLCMRWQKICLAQLPRWQIMCLVSALSRIMVAMETWNSMLPLAANKVTDEI